MLAKSRSLLGFRKGIVRLLTQQLGYKYEDMRKRHPLNPDVNSWMLGPRVGELALTQVEHVNIGEAYYRADFAITHLEFLGMRQVRYRYYMQDEEVPTPQEARERAYEQLLCGHEFEVKRGQAGYDRKQGGRQFGTVQYINWLDPEANTFTVHEGWRGVLNDGVAWDLVISINSIPLVGVMLAPTTPGHRPCEEAYQLMRQQIDADPCFGTYCQFCLISDGKTTLVGTPDDPPEWFLPWEILDLDRQWADDQNIEEKYLTFCTKLSKQALVRYLRHFVRLVGEGERQMLYAAHCHQVHAVIAAGIHLAQGWGPAYAVLPKSDELLRAYPFDTNHETTRQLFHDYMIMSDLLDDADEAKQASVQFVVEPRMSAEPIPGECVYRPQGRLHSPLADD